MDTPNIMLDVIIALMPAAAASVWLFGWRAAAVIAVSVGSCVAAEFLSRLVMKRPQTVGDLSAVVTGLLLALNLPHFSSLEVSSLDLKRFLQGKVTARSFLHA